MCFPQFVGVTCLSLFGRVSCRVDVGILLLLLLVGRCQGVFRVTCLSLLGRVSCRVDVGSFLCYFFVVVRACFVPHRSRQLLVLSVCRCWDVLRAASM